VQQSKWWSPVVLALGLGACGSTPDPEFGPDRDGDGWPRDLDCDDEDPQSFPAADDPPGDDIDQDCSGSDGLGQGGAPSCTGQDCGAGSGGAANQAKDDDQDGFTVAAGDCDDDEPAIHPGARDVPGDGIDQDCFGGDSLDFDQDGHEKDDCDDENPAIHPGRLEIVLDGIDQNCDGSDLPAFGEPQAFLNSAAVPADPPDLAAGQGADQPVLLAVWADSRTAPRQDLYGQLLDAQGASLGGEIAIDTVDNNAKSSVRVASKGDGFLVTWATTTGVFVRRLHSDGTPNGIVLGYGDAGGAEPRPAFGGGNWAVAWTRPSASGGSVRAMTTEGVRSDDIFELGGSGIGSVALTGSATGFFVVWDGPLAGALGNGISGQLRDSVGGADGSAFDIVNGGATPAVALNSPAASGDDDFTVVYRVSGGLGFVASVSVSLDGEVAAAAPLRLSSESQSQTNLRLSSSKGQLFSAWEDFKHTGGPLSAQAIYANAWKSPAPVHWLGSAGISASSLARLGGIAVVNGAAWLSVTTSAGTGLLFLDALSDR